MFETFMLTIQQGQEALKEGIKILKQNMDQSQENLKDELKQEFKNAKEQQDDMGMLITKFDEVDRVCG